MPLNLYPNLDDNLMKQHLPSRIVLSATSGNIPQQRELFALLNLGLVQSLASGVL